MDSRIDQAKLPEEKEWGEQDRKEKGDWNKVEDQMRNQE